MTIFQANLSWSKRMLVIQPFILGDKYLHLFYFYFNIFYIQFKKKIFKYLGFHSYVRTILVVLEHPV